MSTKTQEHPSETEKRILIIIVLSIILGVVLFILLKDILPNDKGVISVSLSFIAALLPVAFQSGREIYLKSKKHKPAESLETFDIFTFGHSGSGKTELIKDLFLHRISETKSTKAFDYHDFKVQLDLNSSAENLIPVKIADYRGQVWAQLYEAARENDKINALLFIVDIAPAYVENKKYTDEEILDLFSKSPGEEIKKRVFQHIKYVNEFSIQTVFEYSANENLKSVRLVINKIDLLKRLQELEYLDRNLDIEDYAKSFFKETIETLDKFCQENSITDFEVITTSATKHINIKELFDGLLDVYLKTKRIGDKNYGK